MDQEGRFHSLDAVRAFALLLGIVLHGTMSFMPGLSSVGWPIVDQSQSLFLQGTFFVIHIFRMTMFFVIAGFFAHLLFQRRGPNGFIKDRSKRVLLPLVIGWGILIPATMMVFYWALTNNGVANVSPPPQPPGAVPLMHLWFLYLLCLLYVCVLTLRTIVVRIMPATLRTHVDTAVAWLTRQPLAVIPLAMPVALCLYFHENWVAFAGIPTPDMSLIPNLPAFIAYATAFSFGWLLHRQTAPLANLKRTRWAHLMISIVLTAVALNLASNPNPFLSGTDRIVFVAIYAAATWSWTFAIIGAAAHFMSSNRPVIRYLADASYWMYLVHLPVVFALQEAVSEWPLHWSVKFPLILVAAFAVMLASYHGFVRFTFIGRALNGQRNASIAAISAPVAVRT